MEAFLAFSSCILSILLAGSLLMALLGWLEYRLFLWARVWLGCVSVGVLNKASIKVSSTNIVCALLRIKFTHLKYGIYISSYTCWLCLNRGKVCGGGWSCKNSQIKRILEFLSYLDLLLCLLGHPFFYVGQTMLWNSASEVGNGTIKCSFEPLVSWHWVTTTSLGGVDLDEMEALVVELKRRWG